MMTEQLWIPKGGDIRSLKGEVKGFGQNPEGVRGNNFQPRNNVNERYFGESVWQWSRVNQIVEEKSREKVEKQTKIIHSMSGNEWWCLLSYRGIGGSLRR